MKDLLTVPYTMMNIYFYQVNQADLTAHAEAYLALLPPWRTERYHRMKIESGKLEELAAGLLLRYALRDGAGIDLLTAEVTQNPHGKPGLSLPPSGKPGLIMPPSGKPGLILPPSGKPGLTQTPHGKLELTLPPGGKPESKIHFNLSHSGGYIAAVVADCPVGIDVETKSDPDGRVAKRFFSGEEQQAILAAEDPQLAFRRIWTRKEAYVKCTGTGIEGAIDRIPGLADRFGEYSITTLREESAYTLSLAVQSEDHFDPSLIITHDVEELV